MRTQINELDFKGQNIYIGIDVHLKSRAVTVISEGTLLKRFSQSPSADVLYSFLSGNYPNATYKSVYEAGFSGFLAHYRLLELGIENIIVNPSDVPTMLKEKLRSCLNLLTSFLYALFVRFLTLFFVHRHRYALQSSALKITI